MRTIGILLLFLVMAAGCKKSQNLPDRSAGNNVKSIEFSVTSDSQTFTIPFNMVSGASKIKVQGTLTTSLSPEFSSYMVLYVGNTIVSHSSVMSSSVSFSTDDIKSLITGPGIDCKLEFYNIVSIHGPFRCSGSILVTLPN